MFRVSHKPSVSARVEAYLSASRNFGKELSSRAHLWFIVSSHLWHFTRVLRRCRGHPEQSEPQSTPASSPPTRKNRNRWHQTAPTRPPRPNPAPAATLSNGYLLTQTTKRKGIGQWLIRLSSLSRHLLRKIGAE